MAINSDGDVLASSGTDCGHIPHCLATREARASIAKTPGNAMSCPCDKHYVIAKKNGDITDIYVGAR